MPMILVELTTDHDLKPFDCGDADLNGFLMDNAKLFAEKRIGKTFLLMDGDVIAAYFCLFNDKISRLEVSNSAWRKVKKLFPHGKHFCSSGSQDRPLRRGQGLPPYGSGQRIDVVGETPAECGNFQFHLSLPYR